MATVKVRADGSTATCTKVGKKFQWIVAAPTTTIATPTLTPTAGFDGTTIRLGVLTTKTNPVWGQIGKVLTAAMESHIAAINKRGGIAGKYKIELVVKETNYDPVETANQLRATSDNVVGYLSILGTPNVEAVEALLRERNIVASPASQDARWALSPNLLPIANSYQIQAINGLSYFIEQFAANPALLTTTTNPVTNPPTPPPPPAPPGGPIVCAVSVATSFGDAGSEGFRFAQERLKFAAGPIAQIAPTETNLATTAAQLRDAGCQGVLVTVAPQQTLALAVSAKQIGFTPRWIIMGASFSEKIITSQTGPIFEQNAWVVSDGSAWGDPTVPGMANLSKELIAANNRFWTENPDTGLTYGFVQSLVWERLLERSVERSDLSHAGVLAASKEIGAVDTQGLSAPIDYNQSVRLSNARSTIFSVDASFRNALRVANPSYSSPVGQAYRK